MANRVSAYYKFGERKSNIEGAEGYVVHVATKDSNWWANLASNQHDLFLMPQDEYIQVIKEITQNYVAFEIEGSNPMYLDENYKIQEDSPDYVVIKHKLYSKELTIYK